jgi:ATP-dependent exoDNAse (exonuclease V) beta subunit
VHRLFASGARHLDPAELARHVQGLLRPEERALVADPGEAAAAAVDAWRAMMRRPELASLLEKGETLSEVPFSLLDDTVDPPKVLRGAIDLLIRQEDGSMLVVELKTGRPQSVHRRQLALYVKAARAVFSGVSVEGLLVYL